MSQRNYLHMSVLLTILLSGLFLMGCGALVRPNREQVQTGSEETVDTVAESRQEVSLPEADDTTINSKEEDSPSEAQEGEIVINTISEQDTSNTTEAQAAAPTPTVVVPADQPAESVVSSSGEVSAGGSQAEGEVSGDSGAPASSSGAPSGQEDAVNVAPSTDWLVYRDDTYGYEISYPSKFVILDRNQQLEPAPVSQVLFLDKMLADSPIAAFQPPNFSIHVFDNSAQQPLEGWVQNFGLIGGAKDFEPYSIAGIPGIRLSSQLMAAPNEFFYVAHGNYVYRLIPLGPLSDRMLDSFKFTN